MSRPSAKHKLLIIAGVLVVAGAAAFEGIVAFSDEALPLAGMVMNYFFFSVCPIRQDDHGLGRGFKRYRGR
jgi:hypothetical protein